MTGFQKAAAPELTAAGSDTIYWKVARAFALIELENFKNPCGWAGTKLSKLPVVVYDNRGRPKYYEFQVLKDGAPLGVISCFAQKRDGGPTAYVIPARPDYTPANVFGKKVIAGFYPHVLYGLLPASGGVPYSVVDAAGNPARPEDNTLDTALENPNCLTNAGITICMVTNSAYLTVKSNLLFWSNVQEHITDTINLSEGYDSIEDLLGRSRETNGIQRADHFSQGAIVSGFDISQTNSWWNFQYVNNPQCMNWNLSPVHSNYSPCVPTAAGVVLAYYNFTNDASSYYFNATNYCLPKGFVNINQPYTDSGFSTACSGCPQHYHFSADPAYNIKIAYVTIGYTNGCGIANYSYSNASDKECDVNFTLYGNCRSYLLEFNIGVVFSDSNKCFGDVWAYSPNSSYPYIVRAGYYLSPVLHDGYYLLGRKMGFPQDGVWSNGVHFDGYDGLTNGMKWASGGILDYYYKYYGWIGDGDYDITGDSNIMIQSVERNDPFFISSVNISNTGAHQRIGFGYMYVPMKVTYYFLWWTWWTTEYWYYNLIVDGNGAETLDLSRPLPYDPSKYERYYQWRNVFWERTKQSMYKLQAIAWRKY